MLMTLKTYVKNCKYQNLLEVELILHCAHHSIVVRIRKCALYRHFLFVE
jgi:hypothetical protein